MPETTQSSADPFLAGIVELLRDLGIPQEEIDEALRHGPERLLVLYADRAFVPGRERLTRSEVAQRAGIELEQAMAFWRALGFADVPEDERAFTESDVDVLRRVADVINSGVVDRELALQTTRVMGRAAAQVAAALMDTVRRGFDDVQGGPAALLARTPAMLENIDIWLVHVWRRHFAAEAKRAALAAESGEAGTAIVGFADLVGFTGLSQSLDEQTLAAAVSRFESTAVDLIARHGGRTIKMIGDEVMFEAPAVGEGCEIALDLVEAITNDETLPSVRVGLAAGPATRYQGDLFGTAPNLAARLVDAAYPDSILVSQTIRDELHGRDELADEPRFELRSIRPHYFKGFGLTRLWSLRRPGAERDRPAWMPRMPKIPLLD